MDSHGVRRFLEVVATAAIEQRIERDAARGGIEVICVGDATTSDSILSLCRRRWPSIPLAVVDETNTTLEARRLYYEEHPPRGLWRFVPRGLLVPSMPLDGYAALLILRRYRCTVAMGRKAPSRA
ncbi:MAG: hypothetical protein GIW99_05675 [Candidatus Eremiobacteraeota bacterium]|nr:hypothetical protein [Candidatus Eremiobacteraeota bacterium]